MKIKIHKGFTKTIMSYFCSKPLRVVFTILWIIFVGLIITLGFSTNPYLLHVQNIPPPRPYPIELRRYINNGDAVSLKPTGNYGCIYG